MHNNSHNLTLSKSIGTILSPKFIDRPLQHLFPHLSPSDPVSPSSVLRSPDGACGACAWRSRGRTAPTRCALRSWRRTATCPRRRSSSAYSRCPTPTTGAAGGSCTSTVGENASRTDGCVEVHGVREWGIGVAHLSVYAREHGNMCKK